MYWFKRNETKEYIPVENEVKDDIENASADEWIWIEGYKGTLKDMTCIGFQYEIGKQYDVVGDVKECENGFRLCLNLKDVFKWYDIEFGNRFFKVKALVRKGDVIKYGQIDYFRGFEVSCVDKIVAKSIVFTEEITYSSGLEEYINNKYKFIDTEQEYINLDNTNYAYIRKRKFSNVLKELGYSELFVNILHDEKVSSSNADKDLFDIMNKAKAFKEEGVSKDLSVYLLLK